MSTVNAPIQAPSKAFRLDASSVKFAAGDGDKSAPIEMLARTGEPLKHWFWGTIVHDFAGMQHRDRIPIDYEHDTSDPVGVIDEFSVRDGDLYLVGSLISLESGDEADKMIRRSQRGIPYQASIYFDPEQIELEELPEGMTAFVNGRTVDGPAVIVREWLLRGVAVTPHGYDAGTHSKFSASDAGAFSVTIKGASMMSAEETTPAEVADAEVVEVVETETTTTTVASVEDTTELSADAMTKARQMVGLFAEHFGELAASKYFSAGHNLTAAALEHIKAQKTEIAELKARAEAAEDRLKSASLSLGEKNSIDTGKPASKQVTTAASLFRKAGTR